MALNLAAVLSESARRFPDRVAVRSGDERITYRDLWDQARRYAGALRDAGVSAGDRVAILLPNTPDFPRVYFAIQTLGAIGVPVHALLRAEEIRYVLEDSEAKALIAGAALITEGARGAALAGVPCYALGASDVADATDFGLAAESAEPITRSVDRAPGDDAMILYTSGTTGSPKGAVLTHLNVVVNSMLAEYPVLDLRSQDVILACLPLFHTFGQNCVMNAGFRAGATLVLMPRFAADAALELMVTEQVTVFMGVPTMYIGLLDAAKRNLDRPPLRRAISGGAALPPPVIEDFESQFSVPIFEGYGLSETAPIATFNDSILGRKPGTVGHAIWGVEVEIAEPEILDRIELLPPDAIGEIVIRGHNIMSRYLNRPAETAAAIVDGWFRSGDIGKKDPEGFISVLDRTKDMVLRGGFNVYPREVEEALLHHPGIAQVAVIGVPDPTYGEEVCAVVVRAEGTPELSAAELVAWSKARVAGHKYPRRVEFVDALPLGPSGKVLKRVLVETYGRS